MPRNEFNVSLVGQGAPESLSSSFGGGPNGEASDAATDGGAKPFPRDCCIINDNNDNFFY